MKKTFITPSATHIALGPQEGILVGTSTLKIEGEQSGAAGARTKTAAEQPVGAAAPNVSALDF